jgi:hypothetical protein
MMLPGDGKPEPSKADADEASKLLEIELIHRRAEWQRAAARRSSLRLASFAFLFVVIVAVLLAFFVLMPQLREQRAAHDPAAAEARP